MADQEDIENAMYLIRHGFFKSGGYSKDHDKRGIEVEKKKGSDLVKHADIENMEFRKGQMQLTSYPEPASRAVLTISDPNHTVIEKTYLWMLTMLTLDFGLSKSIKITDTYGSSVGTDHWGVMNDRTRSVQGTISQTLQTIGVMVKDLFPMIHELHHWDERIKWYDMANEGNKSGDIALKGVWTDMVDGGPENGASILGLSQKVGFLTLPDLFFGTFVKKPEDVDKEVDKIETANESVKRLLKRKLLQYMTWKEENYKEVMQRKQFTIKYLRQHISAIRLQMSWLKPYLGQQKYLQSNNEFQDNAFVVSTFDTSKFEVESLCTKKGGGHVPVVLINCQYLTFPERSGPTYQYSGFQHAGSVTVTLRGYGWTPEQIENYKNMREEQAMEILGDIDAGFQSAMDALEEEIDKYLKEAGEEMKQSTPAAKLRRLEKALKEMQEDKDKKDKKKKKSDDSPDFFDPFRDIGGAFLDIGKMFVPREVFSVFKSEDKDAKKKAAAAAAAKGKAEGFAAVAIKATYVNYRKAHKMVTW